MMRKCVTLDMDGTIADFYSYDRWLGYLLEGDATPYAECDPIGDYREVDALLAQLKKKGWRVEVVSWLARGSVSREFDKATRAAKLEWLSRFYPSIDPKDVHVVKHGTNKARVSRMRGGLLLDDERGNCDEWERSTCGGRAIQVTSVETVLNVLRALCGSRASKAL